MTTAVAAPLNEAPGTARTLSAFFASLVIHGLILALLLANAQRLANQPKSNEITLDVRTIEKPKPLPPPPKPEPLPAKKIPQLAAKIEKVPPKTPPPPMAPPKEPPKGPPPPIRIGLNLDSTVSNGDFAAPVGNTMYGQAAEVAPAPTPAEPPWRAKYVPQSEVTELPEVLNEVKADYPSQARKDGIEGDVILWVTIDEHGNVVKVEKIVGIGHGLDEAAIDAIKKFKWKPPKKNGIAVSTRVRYAYTWEID